MEFFLADGVAFINSMGLIDRDVIDPRSNNTFILAPKETLVNDNYFADFAGVDLCEGWGNVTIPLYYASRAGLPVSVELLIEKGANVNA